MASSTSSAQFRIIPPGYSGKLNLASVSKAFFFGHKTTAFYPKLRAKSVGPLLRAVNEKADGIDLGTMNSAMEVLKKNDSGDVSPLSLGFETLGGVMTKIIPRKTRRYWNIHLEEMMEAGVHIGHGTSKWNPRMKDYISSKRKGIHIINLVSTVRFLSEACDLVFDAASRGKQFLIVGTKDIAADLVARAAIRARCHYVNKKWLGGMLTNWYTTEMMLLKFRDLRTEQKMGRLNRLSKRDSAMLKRQLSYLQTYLGGIKYMIGLPDVVIIVDQQEEYMALRECMILGIPTICLVDTNCDPDLADISIPANDDAIASIRLILNKLVFAICEGHSSYV